MQWIDREHPEYVTQRETWSRCQDLYVGGEQLKNNASLYLKRRQKEPIDVYAERLDKVFYENYVGSIIDWYAATLFRREPVVTLDGQDQRARRFLSLFAEDCDRRGSSLSEFFRRQIIAALVKGISYTLIDFPRTLTKPGNRAEEEAIGADRAFLVEYGPEDVINWSRDEHGMFDWAVVRTSNLRKEAVDSGEWVKETRWSFYDRQHYRIYARTEGSEQPRDIRLVDEGLHGLANLKMVPLIELKLPEGLWLMNKAGLLQLEHFNKSNALSWALTMGLFAMPIVYSDREWNQIVGESYFIQLGPNDRFGWTEPEGRVFQIASDNLQRLQEEVYRVCFLMTQAGGTGNLQQSGLSKQRDFAITQAVLRAYGDLVKDVVKRVLRTVAAAREDDICIDVGGIDEFDIGDFRTELEDAAQLLAMGINSPTLVQQVHKRLAQKYLCDVRQEVKDRIDREIESQAR